MTPVDPETPLHWQTACQVRDAIVAGHLSAEEATRHVLDRIARLDDHIHAFITVAAEQAVAEAQAVDAALARGVTPGRLAGVPVTIKDQFFTKGLRTTGGSRTLEHHIPDHDSIYVERIRAAGGIVLGKTNTPEFGMYWRAVNYVAEECRNPWDLQRTAGGSSGGAAAGLAAGLGPLAIGSDAGGSIRLPSAQCGTFGLLPSRGRVPRHGGFGSTLFFSAIGPMARDVRDAATLLQVIAGPMPGDPMCRTDTPPDYLAGLEDGIAGVRLACWDNTEAHGFADADVLRKVRDTAELATGMDARLAPQDVQLHTDGMDEAWKVLDFVDRQANLGETLMADAAKMAQLTPYARTRFEWAAGVSGTEYSRALLRRAEFIRHMDEVFADTDLLLAPTLGITSPIVDPHDLTLRIPALVSYTLPVNFAGYCAASVPCGLVNGLSVGLQIIGRPNEEALVLQASRAFEKALNLQTAHPPDFAD